jgi:hypothetical protein
MCAKAIDSTCLSSDLHCFTLIAGVYPPALVAGTGSPTGLLTGATLAGTNGVITWTVSFNKVVIRPLKASYIKLYYSNGTLLFKMDASVFPTVTYSGAILKFQTTNTFDPGSYYILFDYGAGLGSEYCKPESDAVTSPTFWPFSIAITTTTKLATATAPTTKAGATLGLSGLSSTAYPIMPVGWTSTSTTVLTQAYTGVSASSTVSMASNANTASSAVGQSTSSSGSNAAGGGSTSVIVGSSGVSGGASGTGVTVSGGITNSGAGGSGSNGTGSGSGSGSFGSSIISTTKSTSITDGCNLPSFILILTCFWTAGVILHAISIISVFVLFIK